MIRRFEPALPLALLLAFGILLSGCTAFAPPVSKTPDRAAHRTPNLSAFEQKRDEAQLVAARDRAEQGDIDAAVTLLLETLERSPEHLESRLLLADLYAAQDRPADAEEHLRWVLQRRPDHARAHHSLGLLCDVSGRADEAAEHFRRAAAAAPQDEAYRLSLEAAAASLPAK